MTSETTGSDAYDVVLADLKAKRDQIDQTIRMIESLRGGGGAAVGIPSSTGGVELAAEDRGDSASLFLGMSIAEAAKKLLVLRRKALGNSEIASALQAGGLIMTSADPINTIGSILTRRFNQVGDIVRVGRGVWGLKEWYPNRSFSKDKNGKPPPEHSKADAIEQEQPS